MISPHDHTLYTGKSMSRRPWRLIGLACVVVVPFGILLMLSVGSGWTFPHVVPDRIDGSPWRWLSGDRDRLFSSLVTSVMLSTAVGTLATAFGLVIARFVRRSNSSILRFAVYLPLVVSPVIAATSLYDLLIRLQLAGTLPGVLFAQLSFATSFGAVFFLEVWSDRTDRLELLVRSLGGRTRDVWKHVVIPEVRGLIPICFVQCAMFSWLDYGLVSILGGGRVVTLTMRLFGYIREASVNYAAMAAFVLVSPILMGVIVLSMTHMWSRLATRFVRTSHE